MHIYRKIFVLSLMFCVVYSVWAQTDEDIENKIIYRKEKCGFVSLASDGFAVGYRKGISLNGFKTLSPQGAYYLMADFCQ